MTKALKVVMNLYGAVGTLLGLGYIFIPRQVLTIEGFEGDASPYLVSTRMVLGASMVAVGIFLFVAARKPRENILWVKFAILFSTLITLASILIGINVFGDFSQVLAGMLINGGFAAALLVFYPWSGVQSSEKAVS